MEARGSDASVRSEADGAIPLSQTAMRAPDLQQAREAFASAEAESDPAAKLGAVEDALALVDELLEEPGISEHQKVIARNVRSSYLRRLLQQLVEMPNIEVLGWCGYVRLLMVDHKAEVQRLFDTDPALKARFDSFVALWSKEYREAFGKDITEM